MPHRTKCSTCLDMRWVIHIPHLPAPLPAMHWDHGPNGEKPVPCPACSYATAALPEHQGANTPTTTPQEGHIGQ